MPSAAMSARPFTASSRPCRIGGGSSIGSSGGRNGRRAAPQPPRAGAGPAWQDDCLHAVASGTTVDAASSVWAARPVADLAAAAAAAPPPQADAAAAAAAGPLGPVPPAALLLGGAVLAGYGIKKVFDTPSRAYDQNVGQEYAAWTEEGVLEYYWGEHIHLGYYTDEVRLWWKLFVGAAGRWARPACGCWAWQCAPAAPRGQDGGAGRRGGRRRAAQRWRLQDAAPHSFLRTAAPPVTTSRSALRATRRRTSSRPSTTLWTRCCRWVLHWRCDCTRRPTAALQGPAAAGCTGCLL